MDEIAGSRGVRAEPPDEALDAIDVGRPARAAAGLAGVMASLRHATREMGVRRSVRVLTAINQKDGFDCASCAWPDPDGDRHVAEFCENGAKAAAWEATTKRAGPDLFARHSVAELSAMSDHELGELGRLTHPMLLREDATHYAPVSWRDAFTIIAEELTALSSPDEAIFYTSGRTSNEAAFLWQLFVRQLGTNNLPDCSNMCHESSGTALMEAIGVGKGTVALEDFEVARLILIIGQNPGTNHPRMLSTLQHAKRRGATIVAINPLVEPGLERFKQPQEIGGLLGRGTTIADIYVRVQVNGDVALLQGIGKSLLALDDARGHVLDRAFIDEHSEGFAAYRAALEAREWAELERASGVARAAMERVATLFAESPRTITCWGMGLTQHVNAVANIQEIVNLHLLRGQIGIRGAGVCPVRGHSNVQGDRTVGIWERPHPEFLDRLGAEFGFAPPREHGYDTVGAIRAMHAGAAKVFIAMGGNFLQATPDTNHVADALRRCRLTAHVATKPNRAHLVAGRRALILPCLGRTERDVQATGVQFVTTENSMAVVQASRGMLEPASTELRSEPAIVAGLARAVLGARSTVPWEALAGDYDRIRDAIERVIPVFENYNARVRVPGGFHLPNTAKQRIWNTPGRRARFTVHDLPALDVAPDELLLTTVRAHDQFNTTVYAPNDRYRGIRGGRRVLFMHPDDMKARGLTSEGAVDISSSYRGITRIAHRFRVVPYDIPRGCVAAYFPEANVVVPHDLTAVGSNTPSSKSVVVRMRASR